MIRPEQIPDEVVEAAAIELADRRGWLREKTWGELADYEREGLCDDARAAITAALNAWPGATAKRTNEHVGLFHSEPAIILPLPQEEKTQEDPECTCCGGTGVTYQTERRCACQQGEKL